MVFELAVCGRNIKRCQHQALKPIIALGIRAAALVAEGYNTILVADVGSCHVVLVNRDIGPGAVDHQAVALDFKTVFQSGRILPGDFDAVVIGRVAGGNAGRSRQDAPAAVIAYGDGFN